MPEKRRLLGAQPLEHAAQVLRQMIVRVLRRVGAVPVVPRVHRHHLPLRDRLLVERLAEAVPVALRAEEAVHDDERGRGIAWGVRTGVFVGGVSEFDRFDGVRLGGDGGGAPEEAEKGAGRVHFDGNFGKRVEVVDGRESGGYVTRMSRGLGDGTTSFGDVACFTCFL